MNKKMIITKNGHKLFKVIEGKCTDDKCEFKIIPEMQSTEIKIFTMQLFSKAEEFIFDTNRILEITYHKSTLSQPAKIHLKLTNKKDKADIKYETLPLRNLIEPDINTEIPIPLFKVIIPNEVDTKIYTKGNEYKVFDIKDSNVIEIFMMTSARKEKQILEKWNFLNSQLIMNPIEYWVTGADKYAALNYKLQELERKDFVANMSMSSDLNEDIRLIINTVNCKKIDVEKYTMLFVENKYYMGFLGGRKIFRNDGSEPKLAYQIDMENDAYFDDNERKRWKYRFEKEFSKLDNAIEQNSAKYYGQFK